MTVVSAVIVTTHDPVPVHLASLHQSKTEFALGVAVSVTTVPAGKREEQVGGQLIPVGLLDTAPEPDPSIMTTIGQRVDPTITSFVAALTPPTSAPMSVRSVAALWNGLDADNRKSPPAVST